MNELIAQLIAIREFAKDIHYTVHGLTMYGNHIFADFIHDEIDNFIDDIKEDCLLGMELRPLPSKEYLQKAISILPEPLLNDDKDNFISMLGIIDNTLDLINKMDNLSKGEENLVGAIAQRLQKVKGLINLSLEV